MDTAHFTAKPRVLIIEHDQSTLIELRKLIQSEALFLDESVSASEALQRNPNVWKSTAVVLLSRSPSQNGQFTDQLSLLRRWAPEAELIVLSSSSDLDGAIEAIRGGACDYFTKPWNSEALQKRVSQAILRHQKMSKERFEKSMLRTLLTVVDCAVVITRLDGTLVSINPFAGKLVGGLINEVLGSNFHELFVTESERSSFNFAWNRLNAGEAIKGLEISMPKTNGVQHLLTWKFRRLHHFEGQPALLGVGHPLTHSVSNQIAAHQNDRLEASGQIVAGIAQESRKTLQRCQSCLELLTAEVGEQTEAVRLIRRAQAAQDDLHHLFENVRDLTSPYTLEGGMYVLRTVWREAWSHLQSTRHDQDCLIENPGAENVRCWLDPFRMVQVFQNIMENAFDAVKGPVKIHISCRTATLNRQPALCISLQDNGPGLTAEQSARLFEPFYSTKPGGTGLGMAIAQRIIEAHSGQIAVGPQHPGAQILVTLPHNKQR